MYVWTFGPVKVITEVVIT